MRPNPSSGRPGADTFSSWGAGICISATPGPFALLFALTCMSVVLHFMQCIHLYIDSQPIMQDAHQYAASPTSTAHISTTHEPSFVPVVRLESPCS